MEIRFGKLKTSHEFYPVQIGGRGVRTDRREPFTLNGGLQLRGGSQMRTITVPLFIAAKTKAAVEAAIDGYIEYEGKLDELTLTPASGVRDKKVYANCTLDVVQPGEIRAVAFESKLKAGGYVAEPVLTFTQLVYTPSAGGTFGK